MPKHMNNRYLSIMNLQLFAGEGGDDAGDDSGDGDDQDDDESDEDGDDEPRYTQEDLDKAIARTIAKERRKAEKAGANYGNKKKESDGGNNGDSESEKKVKEAEDRASRAEAKNACYEAGVTKDAVDDVVALARSYMAAEEDLDLEDAIEKVVKKYPQFKKGAADSDDEEEGNRNKSWGQRQKGSSKKMSGVEQRFYEMNPDLRPKA